MFCAWRFGCAHALCSGYVGYGDVLPARVYFMREHVFSQGYTLFANFACLCSLKYDFQPDSKLCPPRGIQSEGFFDRVFLFSQGRGQVTPSGTIPSIFVPSATPQVYIACAVPCVNVCACACLCFQFLHVSLPVLRAGAIPWKHCAYDKIWYDM